ncbi:MAG: hypothetical protein IKO40_13715, partial [Kiritimatiellae bacterium]|nr:hypothetical protein [Kiritimatiellia bacterium]
MNTGEAANTPKVLSTGVEIPAEGVPTWDGRMQFTTRAEKRPESIDDEATYLKWKWRMNLANPATGLDNDALVAGVKRIADESGWKAGTEDWYDVAARCFDFLVDNVQIGFSRFDCFPAISAWDRHERPMKAILWKHAAEVDDKYSPGLRDAIAQMRREGRATIGKDFDHSAPDWADILKLGFPGMKARVDAYTQDTPFYRAEKRAAAAIMRFLDRLIEEGKRELEKIDAAIDGNRLQSTAIGGRVGMEFLSKAVASLERLRVGPPQTLFDVMEFTMVYFILSLALESALEKGVDAFSL